MMVDMERQNLEMERGDDLRETVIRDDQLDFAALLDAVKESRRHRARLKLIDSGVFDSFKLEWLAEAGADIYTSDRARPDAGEIIRIGRAAKRGDAIAAYYHQRPLDSAEKGTSVPFFDLQEMGRSGIDLHLSNRHHQREWEKLEELAQACLRGGAWFLFYHHGPLIANLEGLTRQGAWLHLSDESLGNDQDVMFLADCAAAAIGRDANVIVHLERSVPLSWLENIFAAGAFVLFKIPPTDYRSSLRPFETISKKRRPDPRATYIDATFLL